MPEGIPCKGRKDNALHFGCIFSSLSSCSLEAVKHCDNEHGVLKTWHTHNPSYTKYGFIQAEKYKKRHQHYDLYFGPKRILHFSQMTYKKTQLKQEVFNYKWHMPWPFLQLGPFYVRSHVQRYLWRLNPSVKSRLDETPLAVALLKPKSPYIAVHIRLTDNVNDVERLFGVSYLLEQHLHNYLQRTYIANGCLRTNPASICFVVAFLLVWATTAFANTGQPEDCRLADALLANSGADPTDIAEIKDYLRGNRQQAGHC
jgi:hypothetical protein